VLNLSRTVGEAVRIGDDIEVQVERITGNCVRLGFKAPSEVRIYRDEIYRQRASARDATAGPRRYVSGGETVIRARPRPRVAGRKHRDR
jgi:carbon storage regulator CsrA